MPEKSSFLPKILGSCAYELRQLFMLPQRWNKFSSAQIAYKIVAYHYLFNISKKYGIKSEFLKVRKVTWPDY